MLYIVQKDGDVTTEHEWHIGEKNPLSLSGNSSPYVAHVIEVQADGNELDHILTGWGNLAFRYGRVIRFFGDDAKFIVANSLRP